MSTFHEIPTIDVSGLHSEDEADRRAVAEELGKAAKEVGFAQLIGHGVPTDKFEQMLEVTKQFFSLSEEEKMQVYIGNSQNHRGYVPVGEEVFAGATPDLKEAYDLSLDLPDDHPAYLAGNPLLGPNQWPALSGFKERVNAYYEAAFALGRRVLRGFSLALGLPEERFDQYVTTPPSQLRLIHYPKQRQHLVVIARWLNFYQPTERGCHERFLLQYRNYCRSARPRQSAGRHRRRPSAHGAALQLIGCT